MEERDERHRLWLELNCDPSAEAVTVPKESEMKGKTLPSMPFPWGNPLVYPASVPGLTQTDPKLRSKFKRAGALQEHKGWEEKTDDDDFLVEGRRKRPTGEARDVGRMPECSTIDAAMYRPYHDAGRYDRPFQVREDASMLPLTFTTMNQPAPVTTTKADLPLTPLPTDKYAFGGSSSPTSGMRRRPDNAIKQLKTTYTESFEEREGPLYPASHAYAAPTPFPAASPTPGPLSPFPSTFQSPFAPPPTQTGGYTPTTPHLRGLDSQTPKTPLARQFGGSTPGSEKRSIFRQPKKSSWLG